MLSAWLSTFFWKGNLITFCNFEITSIFVENGVHVFIVNFFAYFQL